jgi:putative acetyltransferase
MPEITSLRTDQISEAKKVIYITRHDLMHDRPTLEESITLYEVTWPLRDIDTFEQSYLANDGVFLVISDDRRVIGTGAFRRLDEQACEIKRLWLLPEYQGQGLGYRMIMELLTAAREKGYSVVRLETSRISQPRAYQFYLRIGFYDIPRFGDDPDDVAMELIL